ncbi:MAG: hypothetical protein GX220_03905 [Treponema sp.]|nr:hypothetical protein [Treponema sp.]
MLKENPEFFNFPQVKYFFDKLNLPADIISVKILQCIIEMQFKPHEKSLINIHKMAQKFENKSLKATEVAMYLETKGIEATEENVLMILNLLDDDDNEGEQKKRNNEFLKYLNHKTKTNKHWIFLPFEYKYFKNDTKKINAWGNIRVLIDKNKKKVEKIIFFCKNSRKKIKIVLYLLYGTRDKKSAKLIFCEKPNLNIIKKYHNSKLLKELLNTFFELSVKYDSELFEKNAFFDDISFETFSGDLA